MLVQGCGARLGSTPSLASHADENAALAAGIWLPTGKSLSATSFHPRACHSRWAAEMGSPYERCDVAEGPGARAGDSRRVGDPVAQLGGLAVAMLRLPRQATTIGSATSTPADGS